MKLDLPVADPLKRMEPRIAPTRCRFPATYDTPIALRITHSLHYRPAAHAFMWSAHLYPASDPTFNALQIYRQSIHSTAWM